MVVVETHLVVGVHGAHAVAEELADVVGQVVARFQPVPVGEGVAALGQRPDDVADEVGVAAARVRRQDEDVGRADAVR